MLNKLLPYIVMVAVLCTWNVHALAQQATQMSVKNFVESYQQAPNDDQKKLVLKDSMKIRIETKEDARQLRNVFSNRPFDPQLFSSSMRLVETIKDPALDKELIGILKDEKPFIKQVNAIKDTKELNEKILQKKLLILSENEATARCRNIDTIMAKLGELKSKNAAPVLRELLQYKGTQYYASVALGKIGDTSASDDIREKAYRNEQVNYGGMGLSAAKSIIDDLEDSSKKDKWQNITSQLVNIKDPAAKPLLKRLFTHEKNYVRGQASTAFANLADEKDVPDIIEMTKNQDWAVRCSGIDAMKRITSMDFSDTLISLLVNDPRSIVRLYAAKACGYKKIMVSVPSLEKTLTDKDLRVREEAFISLYILTDKKYDFEGKNDSTVRSAERQKMNPSFY